MHATQWRRRVTTIGLLVVVLGGTTHAASSDHAGQTQLRRVATPPIPALALNVQPSDAAVPLVLDSAAPPAIAGPPQIPQPDTANASTSGRAPTTRPLAGGTPVQVTIALRSAVAPSAIAAGIRRLRTRGLSVALLGDPPVALLVRGTARQVNRVFRTSVVSYRWITDREILTFATSPALPADLAAATGTVFVHRDQVTSTRRLTAVPAAFATAGSAVSPQPCTAAANAASATGAHTADQIASHYNIGPLYAAAPQHPVTVALVEFEPFNPADIAAFQQCYGTHATVTTVQVDGGAGAGTGSGRAATDIEMVIAAAPDANIVVYQAPGDTGSVYDTYARIAADNTAQVVVTSWGICEPTATVSSLPTLERPLFEQMARNGQTVLAAAGDSGSAACYAPPSVTDTSLAVLDPASQPTVTAVGGTSFAGVSDPDISWHTAGGAGGGGISHLWPMPRYQAGATAAQNSPALCNAPTGSACRQVPDISMLADPTHGYVAYVGGTWRAVGGTGAAAATFAGILALIDERCVAGPVGLINPALYRLAGSSALVDVTQGPNTDLTGTNGGAYPPATGVDLATGLGRPDAAALAAALCPPTGAAGAGTITVDPNLVLTNSSTSLTFRYTPASGTGMVNGELDITVPGTWSLPTTTPGQPGYTTADAGVLTVSGNTIVLRSITLPANSTVTVTFGDTSGGPGARTPSAAQITTFATASAPASASGAAGLARNPAVRVLTPGGSQAGQGTLLRIAGADRIGTAIAASQLRFTTGGASAVVLARADIFPDALAGVPLAAQVHGPLLLTPPSSLPIAVLNEIQRVLPVGGPVFLLGGTAALSATVEQQLVTLGYLPHRISGMDRFDTAVQIAHALGDPTTILECSGLDFPDALSAGPAAVITHGAVLLTAGPDQAAATAAYLTVHPRVTRYAIGGPAAHADPGAIPLVGADRYATSVLVAQQFFTAPSGIGIASGAAFPDALAGGPATAEAGGPLLLVPPSGALPTGTANYFSAVASSVLTGWLFGGTAAVGTDIASETAQALVLVPPPS